MTDKELLELAAKAAGYEVRWHENWQCFVHVNPFNITTPPTIAGQRMVWVPLDDDGDALRLAVKLEMSLHAPDKYDGTAVAQYVDIDDSEKPAIHISVRTSETNKDPYAATRRAIVRAAAEIGRDAK